MAARPAALEELKAISTEIGSDRSLVQGAGGNTSIKADGVLWIKASGTWLMDATRDDIFVPVKIDPLLEAVRSGDPAAENATEFVVQDFNPSGLRPSIETTLHALFPQKVVLHVHCVDTISIAIRRDATEILQERLDGLDWSFVPYARPGLPLSRAILKARSPNTVVAVLGNHGLVVAGETVAGAADLLTDVCARLQQAVRPVPFADSDALADRARGSGYRLPDDPAVHAVAMDKASCLAAMGGSLYPDHVIFLGPGSVIARKDEGAKDVAARCVAAGRPGPVAILFPGEGVLIHETASRGAHALAICLSDVLTRTPADARLTYLSAEDEDNLVNWDAEKYRQALAQEQAGGAP